MQVGLVAATGEQVEAHAHHGFPAIAVVGVTGDVVVGVGAQLSVKAWVEGGFGGVVLLLGGRDIRLGRTQHRAVVEHLAARFVQVCRQHGHERGRTLEFVGHLADGAEVVDLRIGQVGLLGDQVVTGLGQARFGLVLVGTVADAALGAQLDLVVDAFVVAQVIFGQAYELSTGQYFQVNLGNGQRRAFGSTEQGVGAGINVGLLTPDFAGGGETVKNHLLQAQAGFAAVERVPVIAAWVVGAGGGVVGSLAAVTGVQVDTRQVATLCGAQLVIGGDAAVNTRLNFRVYVQCLLHGLGQCLGLYETGGENERYCLEQVQTHLKFPRTSCLKSQRLAPLRRIMATVMTVRRKVQKAELLHTCRTVRRININVTLLGRLFRMATIRSIVWHKLDS